jgi:hypothetical protein
MYLKSFLKVFPGSLNLEGDGLIFLAGGLDGSTFRLVDEFPSLESAFCSESIDWNIKNIKPLKSKINDNGQKRYHFISPKIPKDLF